MDTAGCLLESGPTLAETRFALDELKNKYILEFITSEIALSLDVSSHRALLGILHPVVLHFRIFRPNLAKEAFQFQISGL